MIKKMQLNSYGEALGGIAAFQAALGQDEAIDRDRLKQIMMDIVEHDLTDRQRLVMQMYYFDNRTMTDIAAELGVNKSTVSRIVKCAKKRMGLCMKYLW